MTIRASAPAKLVLLGEYAVLESAPALVAAVDRRVTVEIHDLPEQPSRLVSDLDGGQRVTLTATPDGWSAREEAPWAALPLAILNALDSAPTESAPFEINIASAPLFVEGGGAKLGLGSSAAVTVALAAALRLRTARPSDTALEDDLQLHAALQGGRGSGVDVAAAATGGVLAFRRSGPSLERLGIPERLHLGVVWTGTAVSTSEYVASVEALRAARPDDYAGVMETMTHIATQGIDAWRAEDLPTLLQAVQRYREAMDDLGRRADLPIVSDDHRALAEMAESEGVAYKPSGAGGGDVGLLFARSAAALGKTARRAERAGYRLIDLAIDSAGVTARRHEGQSG